MARRPDFRTLAGGGRAFSILLPGTRGSAGGGGTTPVTPPVVSGAQRIIWDDDFDSDIDGISALILALRLVDLGEATMIAATTASTNVNAAPALKACLAWNGYPNIPVGAYQGTAITGNNTSTYDSVLRGRFLPNTSRTDFPAVLTTLRTALAAAPDASVKICVTGTMTNIAELIASPADGISPLTGAQLVAQKVVSIHPMGGGFPTYTAEANISGDVTAANYLAANSPVPVYWAGFEVGGTIFTTVPGYADAALNPLQQGWFTGSAQFRATGTAGFRESWDLMPQLHAVRGLGSLFTQSAPGDVVFASDGSTTFTANASGKNRYLVKAASDTTIAQTCNDMIAAFITAHTAPKRALWTFSEGTGDTFASTAGVPGLSGYLGNAAGTDTYDATWTARGLALSGTQRATVLASGALNQFPSEYFAAAVKFDAASSTTVISTIAARDNSGATQRSWIFRRNATSGALELVLLGSSTVTTTGPVIPLDAWYVVDWQIVGTAVSIGARGLTDTAGTYSPGLTPTTADLTFGARIQTNTDQRDQFRGEIGAAVLYAGVPADRTAARNELASIMSGRGVTVA